MGVRDIGKKMDGLGKQCGVKSWGLGGGGLGQLRTLGKRDTAADRNSQKPEPYSRREDSISREKKHSPTLISGTASDSIAILA